MQAGLRDVVSQPLSLEQLEGSVRAAAQWSRALRDRVTGEESAAGALGGQLIAVAGSKGGVGTTTVALQLCLAAVRAVPGRPVCLVDFDLQKGDLRGYLNLPYRRSVVDLVEVANEISVRHLQETLYTHKEGFRVLLAPDDGERGGGGRLGRGPRGARRGQGAPRADDRRPRRPGVRGERDRGRDGRPRRGRDDARRGVAARRQAAARPLAAPAGARGRGRPRRAQPDVAQARDPARPGAQGRRLAARPDHDRRRVRRVRGRRQHRRAVARRGRQGARARSSASPPSSRSCPAPRRPSRRPASRAACSPAWAASAASPRSR